MSVRCMAWAWTVDIDASSKLVLLALADHANDEDHECWPSLMHLTRKCSFKDKSTTLRHLNHLEDEGLIRRKRGNSNTSTRYILPTVQVSVGANSPQGLTAPRVGAHSPWGVGANSPSNHQEEEPSINHHSPLPPKGGRGAKSRSRNRERKREREPAGLQSFCVARCEICDPAHEWEVGEEYFDHSIRVMACPNWRKNLRN